MLHFVLRWLESWQKLVSQRSGFSSLFPVLHLICYTFLLTSLVELAVIPKDVLFLLLLGLQSWRWLTHTRKDSLSVCHYQLPNPCSLFSHFTLPMHLHCFCFFPPFFLLLFSTLSVVPCTPSSDLHLFLLDFFFHFVIHRMGPHTALLILKSNLNLILIHFAWEGLTSWLCHQSWSPVNKHSASWFPRITESIFSRHYRAQVSRRKTVLTYISGLLGSQAFGLELSHATRIPQYTTYWWSFLDFSAYIIMWANSSNKSPLIYLYRSYWFCVSENPLEYRFWNQVWS